MPRRKAFDAPPEQWRGIAFCDSGESGLPKIGDACMGKPSSRNSTGSRVAREAGLSGDVERKRRMKAQELKEKTPEQLQEQLVALKKEAFNLRFQQATGQLESTARMRSVRRDVARVKTVLNQKAADAASSK